MLQAIEEQTGQALAKSWGIPDILRLVNAFQLVQLLLNEKVSSQLSTLLAPLGPEKQNKEVLDKALQQCRSQTHVIFHHLRYQTRGAEIKANAAKFIGSVIKIVLCVSKAESLLNLLSSTPLEWTPGSMPAIARIGNVFKEIDTQTASNTAFRSQHAAVFEQGDAFQENIPNAFRKHAWALLEASVMKLDSENIGAASEDLAHFISVSRIVKDDVTMLNGQLIECLGGAAAGSNLQH